MDLSQSFLPGSFSKILFLFLGYFSFLISGYGEDRPVPTPEEEALLKADPFYQSFSEAFDNVLTETAPDLSSSKPISSSDTLSAPLLVTLEAGKKEKLFQGLLAAVSCEYLPGAKARRSFIFARGEGDYRCLETGGVFDMTPGEVLSTGRSLDAAINGEGFFQFKREKDGQVFYSRAGNFLSDRNGGIFLEREGEIYRLEPPAADPLKIEILYRFSSPEWLESNDSVFFQPTERSGEPQPVRCREGELSICPKHLENSNGSPHLILREIKKMDEREELFCIPLAEKSDKE